MVRGTVKTIWALLILLGSGLVLVGLALLLESLGELIRRHRSETGYLVFGIFFALLDWMSSWPAYVWLGLLAILALMGLHSKLNALAARVEALRVDVNDLRRMLAKEGGDDDDEWDDDDF